MTVIFTAPALADLDEILAYTAEHYPGSLAAFGTRMDAVLERIACIRKAAAFWTTRRGSRRPTSSFSVSDFLPRKRFSH